MLFKMNHQQSPALLHNINIWPQQCTKLTFAYALQRQYIFYIKLNPLPLNANGDTSIHLRHWVFPGTLPVVKQSICVSSTALISSSVHFFLVLVCDDPK